jgi:glutathione S-transferase
MIEKGLEDGVEVVAAQKRLAGSTYYAINPSGRVPYLIRDDGIGMQESALICDYLDHLDGKPCFGQPASEAAWEARRLGALATSLMDGLSVWNRELGRPEAERSPGVIEHEMQRAARMTDLWEHEAGHALLHGPLSMVQLTLACALGLDARVPEFRWRPGRPRLAAWFGQIAARPSLAATMPPLRQ